MTSLFITSKSFNNDKVLIDASLNSESDSSVYSVWPMHALDKVCLDNGLMFDVAYVFDNDSRIDVSILQHGLSITLKSYPTFSGRIDPLNRNQVILNDKGALFIAGEELDTLVSDVIQEETELKRGRFIDYSKSTKQLIKGNEPLLRVKLTNIKDGCVLGVWASHGICDGATFYQFIRDWSKICDKIKSGENDIGTLDVCLNQNLLPYLTTARRPKEVVERELKRLNWKKTSIFRAIGLLIHGFLVDGTLKQDERTKPVLITSESLKQMKSVAEEEAKSENVSYLTTNEVLSSFTCQLIGSLFEFENGSKMSHITMINIRSRYPGVTENLSGNASFQVKTCEFNVGDSLGKISATMHNGLLNYKSYSDHLRDTVAVFLDVLFHKLLAHSCDPTTLPMLSRKPRSVLTNNFALYPIYQVSFGTFQKPRKVIPHHSGNQVLIWPRADERGVDVYFQGSTAKRINNLPKNSPWFTELSKYADISNLANKYEQQSLKKQQSNSLSSFIWFPTVITEKSRKIVQAIINISPVSPNGDKSPFVILVQTFLASMCFLILLSAVALPNLIGNN